MAARRPCAFPPLLEKYALSICSGDFNQWTRKVAATDEPFSFMRTIEWEMPYWNWGHTFDYAEMAYLIFPRPFMVERGHLDLVGPRSVGRARVRARCGSSTRSSGWPTAPRSSSSRAATASTARARSRSCTSTCAGRRRGSALFAHSSLSRCASCPRRLRRAGASRQNHTTTRRHDVNPCESLRRTLPVRGAALRAVTERGAEIQAVSLIKRTACDLPGPSLLSTSARGPTSPRNGEEPFDTWPRAHRHFDGCRTFRRGRAIRRCRRVVVSSCG